MDLKGEIWLGPRVHPNKARKISERATELCPELGDGRGGLSCYSKFYEEPLRKVVNAYQPLPKDIRWREVIQQFRKNSLHVMTMMRCRGHGTNDCEELKEWLFTREWSCHWRVQILINSMVWSDGIPIIECSIYLAVNGASFGLPWWLLLCSLLGSPPRWLHCLAIFWQDFSGSPLLPPLPLALTDIFEPASRCLFQSQCHLRSSSHR